MAYQLPVFNLVVGIRHSTAAFVWGDPDFSVAQLRGINKASGFAGGGGPLGNYSAYMLKLPAGTDIRDAGNLAFADLVDIDGFSGPLVVELVYDVAFGFENEYRVALLCRQDLVTPGGWSRLPGQGETPET